MKILHIDSSILGSGSVTRTLTADLLKAQLRHHPHSEVIYRDLVAEPLQHQSGAHLQAAQGAPPATGLDVQLGAKVLEEFLSAEVVIIGAPMYNFGVPSQLKAWIDRLAVAGKTFRYTEQGPLGLAGGKKVLVASSRGGAYANTPLAFLDHQEAYLTASLGFFGVTDITFVRVENASRSGLREQSIEATRASIAAL
jgi:FMN-dependent NADH-azoreductase